MSVLVINSGSPSVKCKLINPSSGEEVVPGLIECIGEENGRIKYEYGEEGREIDGPVPDHMVGMEIVLSLSKEIGPSLTDGSTKAIGHCVVQSGKYFDGPVLVDDSVEARAE